MSSHKKHSKELVHAPGGHSSKWATLYSTALTQSQLTFIIVAVHTMAELKLSGNHLKGSRPVLSFSKVIADTPHRHQQSSIGLIGFRG